MFFTVTSAEALKCHQCTSHKHTECGDPMWFEPEKEGGVRKLKTEQFLTDCPTDGKNYTICRKIFQNGKKPQNYHNKLYKAFYEFVQAKFTYGGLILGSSQLTLLPFFLYRCKITGFKAELCFFKSSLFLQPLISSYKLTYDSQ